jgi:hypothetical protein
MPPSKPPITGSYHLLPFDSLSPAQFEQLCYWLIEGEGFERCQHLGAAGSEQGRLATIQDFEKAWAGHSETDLARLEFWRGMTSVGSGKSGVV